MLLFLIVDKIDIIVLLIKLVLFIQCCKCVCVCRVFNYKWGGDNGSWKSCVLVKFNFRVLQLLVFFTEQRKNESFWAHCSPVTSCPWGVKFLNCLLVYFFWSGFYSCLIEKLFTYCYLKLHKILLLYAIKWSYLIFLFFRLVLEIFILIFKNKIPINS